MRMIIQDEDGVTTFQIPDWAKGGRLMLIHNKELVAVKRGKDPWEIKEDRCNYCGQCCLDAIETLLIKVDDESKCIYLYREGDDWLCSAGPDTPIRCLEDPIMGVYDQCSIRRKAVEPR